MNAGLYRVTGINQCGCMETVHFRTESSETAKRRALDFWWPSIHVDEATIDVVEIDETDSNERGGD